MLKEFITTIPQYCLPKHALTRLAGKLAAYRGTWLKNILITRFMRHFKISLAEAVIENPEDFTCFNDFFIRELKSSARPLTNDAQTIVSPCDGTVCQIGSISHNLLFQAKQFRYTLNELLGGDDKRSAPFLNGEFACFYLAPNAYHRVHIPASGVLKEMTYLPGSLFSVNLAATRTIRGLFARNERVVCLFETEHGPMAIVFVGACLVGSIHTSWHGDVTPPRSKSSMTWHYDHAEPIHFNKGDEIGYFKMGSTVLVLFSTNTVMWNEHVVQHAPVQVKQTIGMLHGG